MKHKILKVLSFAIVGILALPALAQDGQFGKTLKPVAGCETKYGVGQDSVECVKNVSLYRESYKNWKRSNNVQYLVDAFGSWKKAMFGCPCATKNIYIDGDKMLSYIIENPTDPVVKEKWYDPTGLSMEDAKNGWIDTLMIMYDRRIEAYGQKCYVNSRKGVALMEYAPDRYEQAFNVLKQSVNCREEESSARTLFEYIQASIKMAENGKIDTTEFFDIYDEVIATVDDAIDKGGRKQAIYKLTKDEINKAAQPFLVCEVLVPSYASKYEANKEDVEFLRKTVNMLDKQGCKDNDVYRNAARQLYALSPDSTAALALAKMEHSLGNYDNAIKYLKDAAEAYKSADKLETVYLIMADAYKELNRYSDSRSAANKALDQNPNNGMAYLLIGDLYASSASSCKYKDMIVAYWVAADAYAKAKSVDPSVADVASSKLGSMKARFPLKKDIFFRNLTVGSSFTVGCWINQTTTVRSSD